MKRYLLAVGLCTWLTATCTRAQETRREVPPGRELQASKLLSPGLTDNWRLDAAEDEMLWCVVASNQFDPVLELVGSDGSSLGVDDGEGTRSELWRRVPRAGSVEFRVRACGTGAGGGNYDLRLERFRTEPLAPDGEASHAFGKEQWWHWRVALHAGDVFVPTVRGDGRIACLFDAPCRTVAPEGGVYVVPRDGDWFLRVEGPEAHRCQVTTCLARQRQLGLQAPVDERVPPRGCDLWRLHVPAGTAGQIELAMPEVPLAPAIADRSPPSDHGPAVVWPGHHDRGGRLRRWLFARRDGDVEVLLRNGSDAVAPYRLACHVPTRVLTPGQPATGELPLGDGDLWQVPLQAGTLLRLSATSRVFDGVIDLWDEAGNVLASVDDAGPLDRDPVHTLLVPRTGTWRALVWTHGSAASGAYELRADVLPVPDLAVGKAVPLQVPAGGEAFAHLHLLRGEEVWLSVRSRGFATGLVVVDPAGDAGFRSEGGGVEGGVLVAYKASHDGVHTLRVYGRGGNGGVELRAIAP